VTRVPDTDHWLFSVQRSSDPILYDPATRRVIRMISLAGRGGNPAPVVRRTVREVWATDYDTLVRVEPVTWTIIDQRRLQGAGSGSSLFLGELAFDTGERRCAIARPFSGDVLVIDAKTWQRVARIALPGQPLDVALLSDGRVVARDWTSGAVATGSI